MYCPKCGAENADDVRFCRACGSGTGLESVALALSGAPTRLLESVGADERESLKAQEWLAKYAKARRDTTFGAIMTGAAALAMIIASLVMNDPFPLVIIWTAFLLLGILKLASGIGSLTQSKTMLRGMKRAESATRGIASAREPTPALSEGNTQLPLRASTERQQAARQVSVTEATTELLKKSPRD